MNEDAFLECFQQLTGHCPFGWQRRLYERLLAGDDLPTHCDIPTGLGKTAVLAVWLLALAEQARRGAAVRLPRRLIYIVDRRVVVDQASDEAMHLLERLTKARAADGNSDPLRAVAETLRGLAASNAKKSFALSTLRGAMADNREWSRDPAKPAIIVGTVDMIGSRLLFSGYGGLGRYGRSQHAALLGQDALVVLDEAHLARAFANTLDALARRIRDSHREFSRPFHVMLLSATQPKLSHALPLEDVKPPLRLDEEDFSNDTVVQRWRARKDLRLIPPPPEPPEPSPTRTRWRNVWRMRRWNWPVTGAAPSPCLPTPSRR